MERQRSVERTGKYIQVPKACSLNWCRCLPWFASSTGNRIGKQNLFYSRSQMQKKWFCIFFRSFMSLDSTFFPTTTEPTDALPRTEDCELGSIVKGGLVRDHSMVNLLDKRWCAWNESHPGQWDGLKNGPVWIYNTKPVIYPPLAVSCFQIRPQLQEIRHSPNSHQSESSPLPINKLLLARVFTTPYQ